MVPVAVLVGVGALVLGGFPGAAAAGKPEKHHGRGSDGRGAPQLAFDMVVSAGAASCLPNARGHVTVQEE